MSGWVSEWLCGVDVLGEHGGEDGVVQGVGGEGCDHRARDWAADAQAHLAAPNARLVACPHLDPRVSELGLGRPNAAHTPRSLLDA